MVLAESPNFALEVFKYFFLQNIPRKVFIYKIMYNLICNDLELLLFLNVAHIIAGYCRH